MEVRCKRCGFENVFKISDVREVESDAMQYNIFGECEKVVIGRIICKRCGSYIDTENKKELINKEKNNI